MFSKATANFVRQVDPEGSLIHVSRVNDSHKLLPMAVVVKRKRLWAWQRPKYQPTDFTLGDLLQGDEVLRPGRCACLQGISKSHTHKEESARSAGRCSHYLARRFISLEIFIFVKLKPLGSKGQRLTPL